MNPERLDLAMAEIDGLGQFQGSALDPIKIICCGFCQDEHRQRQVIALVYATRQGELLRANRKRAALSDGTRVSAGSLLHFLDEDADEANAQWWGNCARHGRSRLPSIATVRAATRGSTLLAPRSLPGVVE